MSNVQNKSSPFISLEIRSFEFWSFEIVSSRVGHCADQFGRHSGLPYNPNALINIGNFLSMSFS